MNICTPELVEANMSPCLCWANPTSTKIHPRGVLSVQPQTVLQEGEAMSPVHHSVLSTQHGPGYIIAGQ
jgi:hypothetical protein